MYRLGKNWKLSRIGSQIAFIKQFLKSSTDTSSGAKSQRWKIKKREKERKEKTVGVSYSGRRWEGPRSGLRQITERKKRPALILKTSARP